MSLSVTICLPGAPPSWTGRVLASRVIPRSEARAFADRNADTWRCALEPGERRFLAIATDHDGRVVFVREYGRETDSKPTEYRRAALREMRGTR